MIMLSPLCLLLIFQMNTWSILVAVSENPWLIQENSSGKILNVFIPSYFNQSMCRACLNKWNLYLMIVTLMWWIWTQDLLNVAPHYPRLLSLNYWICHWVVACFQMTGNSLESQLMSYCIKHELITIDQFAFLKYHSTVGCLHRVIDDWYDAMNEGEYIMSCFLDVQKCFDYISHDLLLTKLSLYGINGTALTWFHNYLTNRRQFVHVNGASSSLLTIHAGIPQESALGPLLFLIFINDLPQYIEMPLSMYLLVIVLYIQQGNHSRMLKRNCNNPLMMQPCGSITINYLSILTKLYAWLLVHLVIWIN